MGPDVHAGWIEPDERMVCVSRMAPSMKSVVALRNSSSIVSMRFFVSGPVSSHFCLPQAPKRGSSPGVSVGGRNAVEDAARAELRFETRDSSDSPDSRVPPRR